MTRTFKWAGLLALVYSAYLLLWPVQVDPVSWQTKPNAGYSGDFEQNDKLKALEFLDLDGHIGPEDAAVGSDGKIYAATHNGDIISIDRSTGKTEVLANTGGRPLGIEFGNDGILYVADAYRGLVAIDMEGSLKVLADKVDNGTPIKYADDLDVAKSGEVYFSDATTKFGAREYEGTLNGALLDLLEHGPNGRILKYDPASGKTSSILEGYSFANGVALSNDESFLLFAETGTYSIHKLWLNGDKKDQVENIVDNLPGFPDNINANDDGSFWFGLVSPRSPVADMLSDKPFLRKIIQRLPASIRPKPTRYGIVVRIDGEGNVLETLQDPSGDYALTTGAIDAPDGSVVITSLTEARLGILAAQKVNTR